MKLISFATSMALGNESLRALASDLPRPETLLLGLWCT